MSQNQNAPEATSNLFYLEHRDQGHSPALMLTAILLNCVGLPGFLLNLSVVLVTIRHRSLHGSANFLLALTSLFEMGHESGHLLFLWMALSGQNFLPYSLCFLIMTVPIFSIGGIFSSMVSTGLDRFLSVIWPHLHMALPLPAYLGLHCLFCCAVSTWLWLQFFQCSQTYANYPVTGYISDLIIGQCGPAYTYSSMASNVVTILLYLVVGLIIKCQASRIGQATATGGPSTNQRLFRSLAVIIVANIGGYFYVSVMRALVLPLLQLSPTTEWYINSYDGILLNISSAINAPILYLLSKDYRTAFDKELAKLPCRRLGTVAPQTNTMMVATTRIKRAHRGSSNMSTIEK